MAPVRMGSKLVRKKRTIIAQSRLVLTKELLNRMRETTRMNDEEITYWFKTFHQDCPTGFLTERQFVQFYKQAFQDGDPSKFAKRIFYIFDKDKSGTIDFPEFLLAMDLFEKGSFNEKLRYAFQLYDVDRNGILTRSEIMQMIKMTLALRGETANDHLKNTIVSQLDMFLSYFDTDGDKQISLDEFCTVCEQDELLRNFLSSTFST